MLHPDITEHERCMEPNGPPTIHVVYCSLRKGHAGAHEAYVAHTYHCGRAAPPWPAKPEEHGV